MSISTKSFIFCVTGVIFIRRSILRIMSKEPIFLGIEGGGTTWKVAFAVAEKDKSTGKIIGFRQTDYTRVDTTTPEETFGKIKTFIGDRYYDSLGIATFGPIDPKVDSSTYGYITTTPKPGWQNVDVVGYFNPPGQDQKPCKFDTDVNAPALAEHLYNRQGNDSSVAYITVGTGIGVGMIVNNKPVHGLLHPEGGHITIRRRPGDTFPGAKGSLHGDDLEALVAINGIAQRAKCEPKDLKDLSDDDDVWGYVSEGLAQLCTSLIYITSIERIVISGGVMNRKMLYNMIRGKTLELLKGYIKVPQLTPEGINDYIVESKWGDDAGITGALCLAHLALEEKNNNKTKQKNGKCSFHSGKIGCPVTTLLNAPKCPFISTVVFGIGVSMLGLHWVAHKKLFVGQ